MKFIRCKIILCKIIEYNGDIFFTNLVDSKDLPTKIVGKISTTDNAIELIELSQDYPFDLDTVGDHIVPHRGDQKLFWDRSNWKPLCEHHHNVKTMTEDRFKEYRF